MAKFKVGDVVRLLSGGDAMTVVEVQRYELESRDVANFRHRAGFEPRANDDLDQVSCMWFQVIGMGDGRPLYAAQRSLEAFPAVLLVTCNAFDPRVK